MICRSTFSTTGSEYVALMTLILGNRLARLADVESGHFSALKALLLGSNNLPCGQEAWKSVDAMNSLVALEETRLTGNELVGFFSYR